MKKSTPLIANLLLLLCYSVNAQQAKDYTPYVNPFIATGGHGHTFPGACVPNGLVQMSPTTDTQGWDWASGYHYSDSIVMGFSHTHLSGTGVGDLGNLLLMPRLGKVINNPGTKEKLFPGFRQHFSKKEEKASIGYYSTLLQESGVKSELTATAHCGMHAYTFPASDSAQIFIEPTIEIGDKAAYAKLEVENDSTISGMSVSFGWFAPFHLGIHLFKNEIFNLPNGKTFSIISNLTTKNNIAKSVWLNGRKLYTLTISHSDIVNGGVLKFEPR